ncbi:MAG: hypothetical protein SGJ26_13340 [Nitrospirota bacterium]|nr:hypothetical protein [Nitrospirota bacterium]
MVTANTLTGTITMVDPRPGSGTINQMLRVLGCDPGCHGLQFGAKEGGGYYAYVWRKFSNSVIIVDPDPNNDGNPSDAVIVGRISLTSVGTTATDDTIVGNRGMGGQGI